MLRVRFPNGQCLQYNAVVEIEPQADGRLELLEKHADGNRYIQAVIMPGTQCVYEWVNPCAVTNPLAREMTPESALALVRRHLRTLPLIGISALKIELRDFNARSRCWKS